VVLAFGAVLAAVNGPVFAYRSWANVVSPYGGPGRWYWALAAVANVGVGTAGVGWALRQPDRTGGVNPASDGGGTTAG
jgi:hypothetical protein